jgi:hypothetical protein
LIQEHEFNVELSKEVYKKCEKHIELKMCYNNVFNVLSFGYGSEFYNGTWKIAYGYVTAIDGLMARHCFIVDSDGQAIDPTIVMTKRFDRDNRKHISFAVLDFPKYIKLLEEHNGEVSLFRAFREEEMLALKWSQKNNVFLCG